MNFSMFILLGAIMMFVSIQVEAADNTTTEEGIDIILTI